MAEVITAHVVRSISLKKIEISCRNIEIEAGFFFSLGNWTSASQTVDWVSSYFLLLIYNNSNKDNSVEINQRSDSTDILHQTTAIVLVLEEVC